MEKNTDSGLSCYKFLNDDDCSSVFQIPSQMVKNYGDNLPPMATLRIDESGKYWRVAIEKFRGQYFFTHGWKEFAQAVDLKSLDYVLLKSAGLSASPVSVSPDETEINGCDPSQKGKSGHSLDDQEEGSDVASIWNFTKELKKNKAYRLGIPKHFARGTGIDIDRYIILKDAEGRKWPVRIVDKNYGHFHMCGGWNDFLVGNNVIIGSTMYFKHVPNSNNTIEARVIKEGPNKKELFNNVKWIDGGFDFRASPKTSSHERGIENSHMNVEVKKENHLSQEENGFGVGIRSKFSKKLKEHDGYKLGIPEYFATETGIGAKIKIKLQDDEGRKWPVFLKYKKSASYDMTSGWIDFLVGNKVTVGSTVSFEFVPNSDNVIRARVFHNGTKENQLFVKRGRGRPPRSIE